MTKKMAKLKIIAAREKARTGGATGGGMGADGEAGVAAGAG